MTPDQKHSNIEKLLGSLIAVLGFFLVSLYTQIQDNSSKIQDIRLNSGKLKSRVIQKEGEVRDLWGHFNDALKKESEYNSRISVLESKN